MKRWPTWMCASNHTVRQSATIVLLLPVFSCQGNEKKKTLYSTGTWGTQMMEPYVFRNPLSGELPLNGRPENLGQASAVTLGSTFKFSSFPPFHWPFG